MSPTRKTQPYRKGARAPGAALTAMLRGRTNAGWNPQDIKRAGYLSGRPKRRPRPKRRERPPR